MDPVLPTAELTPDQASEYLTFSDATRMNGSPSQAADGQLTISVYDTIFVVKGIQEAAARLQIKHETSVDIQGFFVYLDGASFFYDVPALTENGTPAPEDADSLSVLVLDFQPEDVSFPYTIPVIIQPHGPDNLPVDEFVRKLTVEVPSTDPASTSSACSIMADHPCPGQEPKTCPNPQANKYWKWEFTYDEGSDYFILPGVFRYSQWDFHGCCTNNGFSVSAAADPRCRPGVGNGWQYKALAANRTGHERTEEVLAIYRNGTFYRRFLSTLRNVDPVNTDFCGESVDYIEDNNQRQLGGTHTYSDGDEEIRMVDDSAPAGIPPFFHYGGKVIHTCHSLIIREGVETTSTHVYRRYLGPSVIADVFKNPETHDFFFH
ncbi:MAG: hypothetical protein AAF587_29770 [Bacteroidota bacterium]